MDRPPSRDLVGAGPGDDDDRHLTLRVSRWWLSFVLTLAGHAAVLVTLALLPEPPRPDERVEFTLRPPPPPSSSSSSSLPPSPSPSPPAPPPTKTRPPSSSPPAPSPLRPALPPSAEPPDARVRLPVVEDVAPTPSPPSSPPAPASPPSPPSSWRDRLLSSLASPPPPPPASGPLEPSSSLLRRVADADARLHDDRNEKRLIEDYGPFFRRGLEALRGHWHPDDVLDEGRGDRSAAGVAARADVRDCARATRTTLAIAVIDRRGEVIDVELKTPSGCPRLDVEAIAAFRRVARFPYPPDGLFVDGAGEPAPTARLPVRFIVSFDGGVSLDWR